MPRRSTKKGPVVPETQLGSPPAKKLDRFKPKVFPPPAQNLPKDLEKYVKIAIDMGAADARVVPAKDIPLDTRAHYMFCHFPRCRWLNSSVMCPTERGKVVWEEANEVIKNYEYAVAYKVLPPGKRLVSESADKVGKIDLDMYWTMGGGPPPDKDLLLTDIVRQRIVAEILRKLEQEAYYDGYLLSMSLGVGSCLVTWCSDTRRCRALEKGGFCPIVNSRPTGNSEFYVDYHSLGRMLGWGEMQPRGNCALITENPDYKGYYNIGLTLVQ